MSNCRPFEIVGRDSDFLCRRMRFTFGGRQVIFGGAGPTCACVISTMSRKPVFCVVLRDGELWKSRPNGPTARSN